jgi:hypothetical protein
MEFLTALATISKSGLALLATMESSADPSRVAVFETYRGVLAMNARMGQAEKVLLAVHEDVSNIPATLREALLDQEARTATTALRNVTEGQLSAYERYVDNIGSDELSLDRSYEIYSEDLKRRFDRLEAAIFQVIDNAPLALDEVLAGVAMEIYFLRTEGNSFDAIENSIEDRFKRLNAAIENRLNPLVSLSNDQMLAARTAIQADTNLSDWTKDNLLVLYPASFQSSWGWNNLYVACLKLHRTELDANRALYLSELSADFPLYEIFPGEQLNIAVAGTTTLNTCGTSAVSQMIENRSSSRTAPNKLSIEGITIDWIYTHPSQGKAFGLVYNDRSAQFASFVSAVEAVNLATIRYSILVEYRDNLLVAMSETRSNLEQFAKLPASEELDQSFLAEIEHLGTALGEIDRDSRIFDVGRQEAALNSDVLRRQLVEAAMAADRQIAAGQARFEAEIEASQSNDSPLLRNLLKQIGLGVRVFKATEIVYNRVQSLEEQLAGKSPDVRYDIAAAREALNKLESLGIPTVPPNSLDLTAREVAAQEFLGAASAGTLEVLSEDVVGANRPTEVTKVVLRDASNAPAEIIKMRGIAERYLLAIIEARMKYLGED